MESLTELRKAHGLEGVSGASVTFELVLNPSLSLDSLEDKRAGIELLSFRPTGDDSVIAIVFVPDGQLAVFEKKLVAYLDSDKLTRKGKRRNETLVNSIERIRKTVLEDLWTDPLEPFPTGAEPVWWEVWVRQQAGVDRFRELSKRLEIQAGEKTLRFPDRTVVLARATTRQMALSAELLDSIAELREARSLAVELLDMDARTEADRVDDLADRTGWPTEDCPAVCLLDTGIDVGHRLLEPGLDAEDAHGGCSGSLLPCPPTGTAHPPPSKRPDMQRPRNSGLHQQSAHRFRPLALCILTTCSPALDSAQRG